MRGPAALPFVIAAGGTGGHFFPAEALAAELIARGHRVVLLTDSRSGGLTSPVFSGRESFVLPGAGIAGRGPIRAGKAVFSLSAGIVRARSILAGLHPAAIIAFGGYPSVPPVIAARLIAHRPPVILHEQNAILGRANRFLSRHATLLALSFVATELVPDGITTEVTGNPVRPAIAALFGAGYVPCGDRIQLLVLGGSLGARVFSDVVPAAIAALPDPMRSRVSVVQQCRGEDLERVHAAYTASGIHAELSAFFPDVAARLGAAHLVIARAGASTVAEIAVAGRPSILVPLPTAIDDHQSANARALIAAHGATAIAQDAFTPATLTADLVRLLSKPGALAHAARAARTVARPNAASVLADRVEALARQEARS